MYDKVLHSFFTTASKFHLRLPVLKIYSFLKLRCSLYVFSFWGIFHEKPYKKFQKQPSRGVLRKRCSENMQQIYRRTPIPKGDVNFIEISLRYGCSPVNLLHIFRTPFPKNTSRWLLLTS